jgi:hypothetical protein
LWWAPPREAAGTPRAGWISASCDKEDPRKTPGEDPRARRARTENGFYLIYALALARSQGVKGGCVTTVKELEPALRRGVDRITRDDRPYLIDVTVAREGVCADSTWHPDWQL